MKNSAVYVCLCLLAVFTGPVSQAIAAPLHTPYAQHEPLAIHRVVLPPGPSQQYGCVEMVVALSATYDNPFDPTDIAVDAQVTLPNGKTRSVPGFLYRPFERRAEQGNEILTPSGVPGWRVRWTPPLPGAYSVVVTARDRTGQRKSEPLQLTAQASDAPGFVRVSPRDHRYFEFDSGRPFYPIGLNMCWGNQHKTLDYDLWLPAFGRVGCNFIRLWLSPGWNALALERPGQTADGLGMGQFDLAAAWRLDHVLNTARREGLYVKLCFDSFNILRQGNCYPFWEKTPHNAANGGPLAKPTEFWTNPTLEQMYRNKLRYLVARYGYDTHVMAWEFWNEVDIISTFPLAQVRDWHARMARYLRSIDPNRHLITTSFARNQGVPEIDALPEMDYVQTHLYGGVDPVVRLTKYQLGKEHFGKPHYVGEFGADSGGGRYEVDPTGIQVHDSLWITMAGGGSGAAQPWFWESIHGHGLHNLFGAMVKFIQGIDWPGEKMRRVEPRLEWRPIPEPLPRTDFHFDTVKPTFKPSEYNRPRTVQIDRNGVRGQLPLSEIQHGVRAHKELHNPVRLEIDLPWPTQFGVNVKTVSGWSGAGIALRLDGREVVKKDFPNTNASGDHKDLHQYSGWYNVDVPAGKHVVELENTGPDWFYYTCRLRNGVERRQPPLMAWATAGQKNIVAWVRQEAGDWARICVSKEIPHTCPSSLLVLPQIAPGRWQAEIWDTWAGKVVQTLPIDVADNGEARVPLPQIEKDIAVRLKRVAR